MRDIIIDKKWKEVLGGEFKKEYFIELIDFLDKEYRDKTIYPKWEDVFNAFNLCPFEETKVVIIGQDPYHEPNQSHGLCFSVLEPTPIPPSLRNIYKEIEADLGIEPRRSGDLSDWAEQGVLLLNAILTVEAHKAGSHRDKGWEEFTDSIIQTISREKQGLVFILWGGFARSKSKLIDRGKHLILESPHPSPLSAYRGFFGNNHFSKANNYLLNNGQKPIDW